MKKNNDICPNIVAALVYDTKPGHLLSTTCSDVVWYNNSRRVYSKEEGNHMSMQFKRVNLIDMYNQGIGEVAISYQLQLQYRLDCWIHNRK